MNRYRERGIGVHESADLRHLVTKYGPLIRNYFHPNPWPGCRVMPLYEKRGFEKWNFAKYIQEGTALTFRRKWRLIMREWELDELRWSAFFLDPQSVLQNSHNPGSVVKFSPNPRRPKHKIQGPIELIVKTHQWERYLKLNPLARKMQTML